MDNIQRPVIQEDSFRLPNRDPLLQINTPSTRDVKSHAFDGDFDGDGDGPLGRALRSTPAYAPRSVADLNLNLFDESKQQTDKSRSIDF